MNLLIESLFRANEFSDRSPEIGDCHLFPHTFTYKMRTWFDDMRSSIFKTTILVSAFSISAFAEDCSKLARMTLDHATIDLAELIAAGEYTPPAGGSGNRDVFKDLPAFCRVKATLKPSSDSAIKMEVWL